MPVKTSTGSLSKPINCSAISTNTRILPSSQNPNAPFRHREIQRKQKKVKYQALRIPSPLNLKPPLWLS